MKRLFSMLAILGMMSGSVSASGFDEPTGWDSISDSELQATVFTGMFYGGDIARGVVDAGGEENHIATDDGLMLGLRLGKESTYWGLEGTVAGVFADEEVTNGVDGTVSGDAQWYLANLNLLLFPVGDNFADGMLRPFIGAGPGMAYYNSDSEALDSKLLLDINLAAGVKISLSRSLPDLRIDYRWHFIDGADEYAQHCHKEISVGLCFDF
ncbi:MAG: hypothetical protein JW745_09655 [Sedimentisphaerales bacterium]|nr:hypothetical protein [Sedimentisphaerales bacterium]MBN2842940.1 hypothetical protein [Sedimentisphaerales bacterium]